MDKEAYYRDLIKLYEASTNIGINGSEEVVPQENIADAGSDVNQGAPEAEEQANEPMPEEQSEITDPAMMQQEVPAPDPNFELDKQKSRKLFTLFEDLLNYGTIFLESAKYIDISLIDSVKFDDYSRYNANIRDLTEKIKSYLQHLFNTQTYDKQIYTYVLYRTEMITNIKGIRAVLELNKPDEKLDVNRKN